MMALETRPSIKTDPVALAPDLRKADVREVMAASGMSPLQCLKAGLKVSAACQTVVLDGKVVAMFGIVPDLDSFPRQGYVDQRVRTGWVWFLGSDAVVEHPVEFTRKSRQWIAKQADTYDCLANYVDVRNTRHIEWLRRCGFKFGDVEPRWGEEQIAFLFFYKMLESNV